MIDGVQRTLIIGGKGKMAQLLMPYFPGPTTLVDIQTFEETAVSNYLSLERLVRRQTSSKLKAVSREARKSGRTCSICVVSVPNSVYEKASVAQGESKLSNLLGISGRGYRSTLFIHQTSAHTLPSKILEPVSGAVLGLHLLHGPKVKNYSNETVIITTSLNKRKHDKFNLAYEIVNNILRREMGYRHIFQMVPERHDMLMADIQFLTHSMLLILGDALISNDYSLTPENFLNLPSSILILLGRMGQQPVHVYKGIATGNKFNKIVSDQLEALAQENGSPKKCTGNVVSKFGEIRDKIIATTEMTIREQEKICTPMSRIRDGIITHAQHSDETDNINMNFTLKEYVTAYLNSLNSGYETYFKRIIDKVKHKLKVLDFEARVMQKYESLR
ncbi:MAG: prephenate dehydrogenase/arogenate dehydrogenase family protein [Candidatus Scalindua rubra]|uniref:Prephenate dehydrogenase n=1 Tax=Candidatus Scalindua brodae TaxID=237368 RepID=A0A0B0EEX6_9BACT|nr:MAG: prephenate dehydrogenase [Candidatus Scalindua brodae]MBZ0110076.1 prephenate dehydrogenase/arogenate dehydrogenase family protein [Candidatus Scalindua rubra]